MKECLVDLPPELATKFLSFLREEGGTFQVADMDGLLKFVGERAEKYPALLNIFTINEEFVVEHFKKTGELPPGVKVAKTTTTEGNNVIKLEIFRGPLAPKS
jgi:hypothetical protein